MMNGFRILCLGFAFGASVMLAGPSARAEDASPPSDTMKQAEDLARRGLDAMRQSVETLDKLWDRLPRFEAPQLLENGDIVIRRRPAEPARPDAVPPKTAPVPPAGQSLEL